MSSWRTNPRAIHLAVSKVARQHLAEHALPGAVVIVGTSDSILVEDAFGNSRVQPQPEPMTIGTVFDLASLSKVVCTLPCVLRLVDDGVLRLDDRLSDHLGEVERTRWQDVTVRQLLSHSAGVSVRTRLDSYGVHDRAEILVRILKEPLDYLPGRGAAYSNKGFIILGYLIEHVTGASLDQVARRFWRAAGTSTMSFQPRSSLPIAPTEFDRTAGDFLVGVVHDENARLLSGIAGHSGVFSNAHDVYRVGRLVVQNDGSVISRELVCESLTVQTHSDPPSPAWGLGWKVSPEGPEYGLFHHYGFTGTALWISQELDLIVVLLTNRVHPDRHQPAGIKELRTKLINTCLGLIVGGVTASADS